MIFCYLNSIKSYFQADDDCHWKNTLACAPQETASRQKVVSLQYAKKSTRVRKLVDKTYIMNDKPKTHAMRMSLLLIANNNYKMGHFYHAAKGFEAL